jgi:hypothetical protein
MLVGRRHEHTFRRDNSDEGNPLGNLRPTSVEEKAIFAILNTAIAYYLTGCHSVGLCELRSSSSFLRRKLDAEHISVSSVFDQPASLSKAVVEAVIPRYQSARAHGFLRGEIVNIAEFA